MTPAHNVCYRGILRKESIGIKTVQPGLGLCLYINAIHKIVLSAK